MDFRGNLKKSISVFYVLNRSIIYIYTVNGLVLERKQRDVFGWLNRQGYYGYARRSWLAIEYLYKYLYM